MATVYRIQLQITSPFVNYNEEQMKEYLTQLFQMTKLKSIEIDVTRVA